MYEFKHPPRQQTPVRDVSRLNQDELDTWHERVAICVVDGRLTEAEAEAIAWRQVEAERRAVA